MGGLEGRSVVGAVAGNGNHLPLPLKSLDKALLVHRAGAGNNFQVHNAVKQLIVG